MSTITVTLVDVDGKERQIADAEVGRSLMEVGRDANVAGILGDCGGCCDCATCHVYVEPEWREKVGPPNDIERERLDFAANVRPEASRLSCQIALRSELDGVRVVVAPF